MAVETTLEVPLVDPFTGEKLSIPLLGIVDLIVPGEDGAVVVDFKTTAKSGQPLKKVHEVQLSAVVDRLSAAHSGVKVSAAGSSFVPSAGLAAVRKNLVSADVGIRLAGHSSTRSYRLFPRSNSETP
jgi:hypothetical protein